MKGNFHARFWIGGGGSNPFADHTESRNRNVAQRSHGSLKDTFYSFREKMICSCEATGLLANCIVQLTYHSFPETV